MFKYKYSVICDYLRKSLNKFMVVTSWYQSLGLRDSSMAGKTMLGLKPYALDKDWCSVRGLITNPVSACMLMV
ncbi:hypothetical protein HanRHA438_Chr16g0783341 [Helianthus annuus]|nr:hypothetical protein HanRHA438_Chr16g0783341 [Helianthus annuus]